MEPAFEFKSPTFATKLRRSREHLNEYDEAANWWLQNRPYSVGFEVDVESDIRQAVVVAHETPPDRLALMYGDAVQNLRTALDYLVVDLARANSGGHLMKRVESDLMFPITTSRERFKAAVRNQARLACVHPRAKARIQAIQPYRGGQDPVEHPLWFVHELSNIDKHRRIPLLQSVVRSVGYERVVVGDTGVDSLEFVNPGPFKDKAILLRYKPADADVQVNLQSITVGISLGEGLPWAGYDAGTTLAGAANFIVTEVCQPLSAYL